MIPRIYLRQWADVALQRQISDLEKQVADLARQLEAEGRKSWP